jgi:hypothetical protein
MQEIHKHRDANKNREIERQTLSFYFARKVSCIFNHMSGSVAPKYPSSSS